MTVVGQQSIDRALPQAVTEDLPRIVEALLDLCRPECHASNSCRSGRKSRAFGCDYFSSVLGSRRACSPRGSTRALRPRIGVDPALPAQRPPCCLLYTSDAADEEDSVD